MHDTAPSKHGIVKRKIGPRYADPCCKTVNRSAKQSSGRSHPSFATRATQRRNYNVKTNRTLSKGTFGEESYDTISNKGSRNKTLTNQTDKLDNLIHQSSIGTGALSPVGFNQKILSGQPERRFDRNTLRLDLPKRRLAQAPGHDARTQLSVGPQPK